MISIFEKISSWSYKKEEFPNKEDFKDLREKYIDSRAKYFSSILKTNKDFITFIEWESNDRNLGNISDKIDLLAKYLSNFELGLSLVHKKQGLKLNHKDLIMTAETIDSDIGAFVYVYKDKFDRGLGKEFRGKYLLQLKEVYRLVFDENKFADIKDHWEITNINMEDMFLLIGVEEAAHRQYDNKKNKNTVLGVDDLASYHSYDPEFRALFWKAKVVKLYFPQYIGAFRSFIEKNRELRKEYLELNRTSNKAGIV